MSCLEDNLGGVGRLGFVTHRFIGKGALAGWCCRNIWSVFHGCGRMGICAQLDKVGVGIEGVLL